MIESEYYHFFITYDNAACQKLDKYKLKTTGSVFIHSDTLYTISNEIIR